MMDVSVVTGTFGERDWWVLARERAASSVPGGVPWIHAHADTLAQARNQALEEVQTKWVIHLDADDQLDPGYIDAMAKGTADIRVPRLRQVRRRRVGEPFMPQVYGHHHACEAACLRHGNWIVIGACVRTALLREVGGWEEFGWSEDWAAWARMWTAGGTVEPVPDAVYRAWVRPDSRNHAPDHATIMHWHREIERAVWPDEAAA